MCSAISATLAAARRLHCWVSAINMGESIIYRLQVYITCHTRSTAAMIKKDSSVILTVHGQQSQLPSLHLDAHIAGCQQ